MLLFVFNLNTLVHSQNTTTQMVRDYRLTVMETIEQENYSAVKPYYKIANKYVFTPIEQELLLLLIGDFSNFYKQVYYNFDLTYIYDFYRSHKDEEYEPRMNRYHFVGDHQNVPLFEEFLVQRVLQKREEIINLLKDIDDFEHHKDFVYLYLDYLNFTSTDKLDNEMQLNLLHHGSRYLEKYPRSQFSQFIYRSMDEFIEPSWFGFDLNISSGYTSFGGAVGDYMSPKVDIGSDLRFYFHKMFLGMRASFSCSNARTGFNMNDRYVPLNQELHFSQYDLYLGRDFQLSKRFSFLPFAGINMTRFAVHYPSNEGGECPKVDIEKRRVSGWFYGFEAQFHVRNQIKQKTHFAKHKRNLGLYKPYVSFGFNQYMLDFSNIHDRISGETMSFRLGFGWFVRAEKRTVINPKTF
jgi:hypothetical protein